MEKKIKYNFADERFFFLKDLTFYDNIFYLTNKKICSKKILFFLEKNFTLIDFQNEILENQNLSSFYQNKKKFSILSFNILQKNIPTRSSIENASFTIKINDNLNIDSFSKKLSDFGFEFNEIPNINQFSIKGEKIEIGIDFNLMLRIYVEFDKIEEIKLQSINYDLKIENLNQYTIYKSKIETEMQFFNLIVQKDLIIYDMIDLEDFNLYKKFYFVNNSIVFSFI